jgi:TolB-like protein
VRTYKVIGDGIVSEKKASATTPGAAPAPRLSIVVLPFENISGDAKQDYFVDGLIESLTTDLSRIAGSFVIARNSAFSYKGKPPDVRQVGRDLNVRYVLEGSVQRSGKRLRVNVQLIDAESGNHIWAERFDKPVVDLFDMQDEIVARLANTLGAQLMEAEAQRAQRSQSPDAMDLYFQGKACMNRGISPEHTAQARGFYERALALDPGNIEALVGVVIVDVTFGPGFLADDRAARLTSAEAAATKALSLAPNHAMAHLLLGVIQIFTHRASQGIAECERATALDRNLADAHAWIGLGKYLVAGPRKPRPISGRRCGCRRAISSHSAGCGFLALPSSSSMPTRRPPPGCASAWRRTAINPLGISCSAPCSPILALQTRRAPPCRPDSCSIPASPSIASVWVNPATIRLTSPPAGGCLRACEWPGCRRSSACAAGEADSS